MIKVWLGEFLLIAVATFICSLLIAYTVCNFVEDCFMGHTQFYVVPFWRTVLVSWGASMYFLYIRQLARYLVSDQNNGD